jgi:hypothetical protein
MHLGWRLMLALVAGITWQDVVQLVDAIAWPLVALMIAYLLFASQTGQALLAGASKRVRRVSAFGVEVELTPEAATRNKADLDETFRSYRSAIVSEFDRQANIRHVPELRRAVVEQAVITNLCETGSGVPEYRCTIHVRDILLHEAMYQLLDYYPAVGSRRAGRTFSMRFGIVGQAWRSGESQLKEDIQPGDQYVITDWGMLPEEAAAAGYGKRSFAAAVLIHNHVTVGVFYVDSPIQNAFNDRITTAIEASSTEIGLTAALAELEVTMRARGPALTLFDA